MEECGCVEIKSKKKAARGQKLQWQIRKVAGLMPAGLFVLDPFSV